MDAKELVLRTQLQRTAAALAHANDIADKIDKDNAQGWFDPAERRNRLKLINDPDYLRTGAKLMQKIYGQKLATWISGIENTALFSRWVNGKAEPTEWEKEGLQNAIEVTQILLIRFAPAAAKLWWTQPNEYIDPTGFNLPMDEIRVEPNLVRNAALSV